jgi:hypothetical protein
LSTAKAWFPQVFAAFLGFFWFFAHFLGKNNTMTRKTLSGAVEDALFVNRV